MKARLHQQYRRLIIGSVVPLAMIIMALGVYQFLATTERELHDLRLSVTERRITLDAIVQAAHDHVQQMKLWSEDYLESGTTSQSELRSLMASRAVGHQADPGGVFLDAAPAALRDRIGQFYGDMRVHERVREEQPEVDMALRLFPIMRAVHRSAPYFQWSYYVSNRKDFMTIFPWTHSSEMLEDWGVIPCGSSGATLLAMTFFSARRRRSTPHAGRTGWIPTSMKAARA